MKVISAEFIKSCYEPKQFPRDGLPEVAFVGRSNVGKSSLINSLLYRKNLSKVSRTPGKTRSVNFFRVTTSGKHRGRLYVVDLPGYGYARLAKSVRAQWGPMIEEYLATRAELRGVVLLLDSRGLEAHDRRTMTWLDSIELPVVGVATKVDKLTWGERHESVAGIAAGLGLPAGAAVIPYSSVTHEGRDDLWRAIGTLVTAPAER